MKKTLLFFVLIVSLKSTCTAALEGQLSVPDFSAALSAMRHDFEVLKDQVSAARSEVESLGACFDATGLTPGGKGRMQLVQQLTTALHTAEHDPLRDLGEKVTAIEQELGLMRAVFAGGCDASAGLCPNFDGLVTIIAARLSADPLLADTAGLRAAHYHTQAAALELAGRGSFKKETSALTAAQLVQQADFKDAVQLILDQYLTAQNAIGQQRFMQTVVAQLKADPRFVQSVSDAGVCALVEREIDQSTLDGLGEDPQPGDDREDRAFRARSASSVRRRILSTTGMIDTLAILLRQNDEFAHKIADRLATNLFLQTNFSDQLAAKFDKYFQSGVKDVRAELEGMRQEHDEQAQFQRARIGELEEYVNQRVDAQSGEMTDLAAQLEQDIAEIKANINHLLREQDEQGDFTRRRMSELEKRVDREMVHVRTGIANAQIAIQNLQEAQKRKNRKQPEARKRLPETEL